MPIHVHVIRSNVWYVIHLTKVNFDLPFWSGKSFVGPHMQRYVHDKWKTVQIHCVSVGKRRGGGELHLTELTFSVNKVPYSR